LSAPAKTVFALSQQKKKKVKPKRKENDLQKAGRRRKKKQQRNRRPEETPGSLPREGGPGGKRGERLEHFSENN